MIKISGELKDILQDHFTDMETTSQDELSGDTMADMIGDTWIAYDLMSPAEQWTEIMKALRCHGFKIEFTEEK